MQFSIGGVPLKCTKDMFKWSKLKWTLCVYWAQFWRGAIFSWLVLIVVSFFYGTSDLLQTLLLEEDDQVREQILAAKLQIADISALLISLIPIVLGAFLVQVYIGYYTLIKKNYKSFHRLPVSNSFPYTFWSGAFWGRTLLIFLYSLLIGLVFVLAMLLTFLVGGVFVWLVSLIPGAAFATAISAGVLLFLWYFGVIVAAFVLPPHILLHGGTWGFVPVSKQPATLEKAAE